MSYQQNMVEKCECSASPALALKHVVLGLIRLILAFWILGFAMAIVWSVIDYCQKYNTVASFGLLMPFSAKNVVISDGRQMSEFGKFVDTFNVIFPGACRFGSGLGMVVAIFWSLSKLRKNCKPQRLIVGMIAGAMLGGRVLFMFSSEPGPLLIGAVIGAVAIPAYLLNSDKLFSAPDIPRANIDPHYQGH